MHGMRESEIGSGQSLARLLQIPLSESKHVAACLVWRHHAGTPVQVLNYAEGARLSPGPFFNLVLDH